MTMTGQQAFARQLKGRPGVEFFPPAKKGAAAQWAVQVDRIQVASGATAQDFVIWYRPNRESCFVATLPGKSFGSEICSADTLRSMRNKLRGYLNTAEPPTKYETIVQVSCSGVVRFDVELVSDKDATRRVRHYPEDKTRFSRYRGSSRSEKIGWFDERNPRYEDGSRRRKSEPPHIYEVEYTPERLAKLDAFMLAQRKLDWNDQIRNFAFDQVKVLKKGCYVIDGAKLDKINLVKLFEDMGKQVTKSVVAAVKDVLAGKGGEDES